MMRGDLEFGAVEQLKIAVLSETGWFDDAEFKATMTAHGGSDQSQYPFHGARTTRRVTPR